MCSLKSLVGLPACILNGRYVHIYETDGGIHMYVRIELQYKILMMSMTIKTNDQIW